MKNYKEFEAGLILDGLDHLAQKYVDLCCKLEEGVRDQLLRDEKTSTGNFIELALAEGHIPVLFSLMEQGLLTPSEIKQIKAKEILTYLQTLSYTEVKTVLEKFVNNKSTVTQGQLMQPLKVLQSSIDLKGLLARIGKADPSTYYRQQIEACLSEDFKAWRVKQLLQTLITVTDITAKQRLNLLSYINKNYNYPSLAHALADNALDQDLQSYLEALYQLSKKLKLSPKLPEAHKRGYLLARVVNVLTPSGRLLGGIIMGESFFTMGDYYIRWLCRVRHTHSKIKLSFGIGSRIAKFGTDDGRMLYDCLRNGLFQEDDLADMAMFGKDKVYGYNNR